MTIEGFMVLVLIALFGYNFTIDLWQEYKKRRHQKLRDEQINHHH